MSYDGKLMRRAMVRFEEAKQRRADALHARERAVYAAVPRIAEIDAALRETMSKPISSALRRSPSSASAPSCSSPTAIPPTTSRISPTVPSAATPAGAAARSAPA